MIEEVSYPEDLTTWNAQQDPFYLELFGETQPILDSEFAEVLPAGPTGGTVQTTRPSLVYEYWWTIGHPGNKAHQAPVWRDTLARGDHDVTDLWANLREEEGAAGRVYVYFPINANWRIKELVATLKYLSPTATHETMWNKIADTWKTVSPLVDDASKLAQLASVPGSAAAASALSAIAKLQVNNVPQEAISWSVEKVTFGAPPHGVMQGIMWNLPKTVFTELGSRITGSLALSFVPSHPQGEAVVSSKDAAPDAADILAHAVAYGPNDEIWAPHRRGFIRLKVQPRLLGDTEL